MQDAGNLRCLTLQNRDVLLYRFSSNQLGNVGKHTVETVLGSPSETERPSFSVGSGFQKHEAKLRWSTTAFGEKTSWQLQTLEAPLGIHTSRVRYVWKLPTVLLGEVQKAWRLEFKCRRPTSTFPYIYIHIYICIYIYTYIHICISVCVCWIYYINDFWACTNSAGFRILRVYFFFWRVLAVSIIPISLHTLQ